MGKRIPRSWGGLIGTLVIGFLVGVLALSYLAGDELYDYKDSISQEDIESGSLPKADVIVVLTGGRGRIRLGSELWFRYWLNSKTTTPMLFISGTSESADWSTFIQQVRTEVVDVLPPEKVVIERRSTNTQENAEEFVEFLKVHNQQLKNWKTLVLVTSSYHMKRAALLFRRELNRSGFNRVHIEIVSVAQEQFKASAWRENIQSMHLTTLEFLKWILTRAGR